MKTTSLILMVLIVVGSQSLAEGQNWPQAAGPNGDWTSQSQTNLPTSFNVATGKNVLWTQTLEEAGQSGIAVWEDRIFLTIMKPYDPETPNKERDLRHRGAVS